MSFEDREDISNINIYYVLYFPKLIRIVCNINISEDYHLDFYLKMINHELYDPFFMR